MMDSVKTVKIGKKHRDILTTLKKMHIGESDSERFRMGLDCLKFQYGIKVAEA